MTFLPELTTNTMTSDFLLLISHGWVVTSPDSRRTVLVFTFRSWLDWQGVVLAFWISILKLSTLLQNCWHRVIDITSFEKHLKSSLDHNPNNLVIQKIYIVSRIFVKRNKSPCFLRWSGLPTKEGQRYTEFYLVGSTIVKRLRRRQYDPKIIERTIGLLLGPSTALYRTFLKHCTLTRLLGLYYGPCQNLLRGDKVQIFVPSDCYSGLLQPSDLTSLPDGRSIAYPVRMSLYIFLIYIFITYAVRVSILWPICLGGCWFVVYIRRFIYKFLNVCPSAVAGSGKIGPENRLTTPVGWP